MNQFRLSIFFAAAVVAAATSRAETVVSYPIGTILENIAVAPGGDLYVSDLGSGTLFKVSPMGTSQIFGQVPGPLAGVALNTDGTAVGASGTAIYHFGRDGSPTLVIDIAGAGFLNGLTLFGPDTLLAADDTADVVWKVDLRNRTASKWLTGSLLVPSPDGLPIGPNGIRMFQGAVYISVTGNSTILRVPVMPDGSAGAPGVYAASLQIDDFAFGKDGSLFAATQGGVIIRLYPTGVQTTMSTGTLGDAAVAFGRTSDHDEIYVVNNGGAFLGLPDGPGPASIVRLATDTTGFPPESQTTRGVGATAAP